MAPTLNAIVLIYQDHDDDTVTEQLDAFVTAFAARYAYAYDQLVQLRGNPTMIWLPNYLVKPFVDEMRADPICRTYDLDVLGGMFWQ